MNLREEFSEYIKDQSAEALYNEPLSSHCSFKIGGPADILYTPFDENALICALRFAAENSVPFRVLGNGSNVLISDKGLRGVTIKLIGGLTELCFTEDGEIFCGAGVSLKKLCTFALENGLSGLQFAYGIPGSVGGAVYMNAGAYGGEIKNVLTKVRCVDPKTFETEEIPACEIDIAYRSTPFMTNGKIITGAYFSLQNGDKEEIKKEMNSLMAKRKASQPLEYPSAGSTFKRPANGYAAAMIDECGLKGCAVGNAEVSVKHAGFVINKGGASFGDVMGVIEKVRQTVLKEKGVYLETEVEILGE
ncbi:MAG: UDP-N-acetylmuramate dehydrogenase [Oscillospiraceae bacterium]|nr:UDP-N-acetylmuramate dehydrogenase [Oscillospiraceae bacterium]